MRAKREPIEHTCLVCKASFWNKCFRKNIRCPPCHKKRTLELGREWRARNLEKERAADREEQARRRRENPEHMRAICAKSREKNRPALAAKQRDRNKRLPNEQYEVKLRNLYGMTREQFDIMFESQNRCCAICQSPLQPRVNRKTGTNIDHCHTTGKVRGILCLLCNLGLGQYRDNPALLRAAAEYLENNK